MEIYGERPQNWALQISPSRKNSRGAPLEWEDPRPFGVDLYGEPVFFPGGVRFEAECEWHEEHLCVILTLRAEAEGRCARCLEPLRRDITGSLRYIFLPSTFELSEDASEEYPEEEVVTVDSLEQGVTLTQALWETLLASLPRVFLCREDCRGICPDCGANLNEETCSCASKKIDPRLACLAELHFPEEKEGSDHGSSEK